MTQTEFTACLGQPLCPFLRHKNNDQDAGDHGILRQILVISDWQGKGQVVLAQNVLGSCFGLKFDSGASTKVSPQNAVYTTPVYLWFINKITCVGSDSSDVC